LKDVTEPEKLKILQRNGKSSASFTASSAAKIRTRKENENKNVRIDKSQGNGLTRKAGEETFSNTRKTRKEWFGSGDRYMKYRAFPLLKIPAKPGGQVTHHS